MTIKIGKSIELNQHQIELLREVSPYLVPKAWDDYCGAIEMTQVVSEDRDYKGQRIDSYQISIDCRTGFRGRYYSTMVTSGQNLYSQENCLYSMDSEGVSRKIDHRCDESSVHMQELSKCELGAVLMIYENPELSSFIKGFVCGVLDGDLRPTFGLFPFAREDLPSNAYLEAGMPII